MAAGIAHEVKNPLTALKGYAELLPARKNDPAFLERFGRVVLDEVGRLDRLVGDLLALARPPAGPPREVDLRGLAEGLAELVRPEAAAAGIDVAVETGASPATVRADAEALRRALLNLARNAIEAMRETGGALTLRVRREEGEALIDVADTGPGVPPDIRARLFEPFVSGRPGGTGLGLAIAARNVASSGGRIEARSTPGEGAVFTVRIPTA
jgi:signal transduction histidine kinase